MSSFRLSEFILFYISGILPRYLLLKTSNDFVVIWDCICTPVKEVLLGNEFDMMGVGPREQGDKRGVVRQKVRKATGICGIMREMLKSDGEVMAV